VELAITHLAGQDYLVAGPPGGAPRPQVPPLVLLGTFCLP